MKTGKILDYLLLATILTLPFAGAHVFVLGVPIYMPELMVIFASAVCIGIQWRTCSSETEKLPRSIVWPIVMLVIGLLSSAFFNGITAVQIGIIKSWFFFPLLFAWLVFQRSKVFKRQAVLVWYTTLVITAIISLSYFLQGQLTYDADSKPFTFRRIIWRSFFFPESSLVGISYSKLSLLTATNRIKKTARFSSPQFFHGSCFAPLFI